MAVYLVTYDLNKEVRRPPIVQAVKKVSGDNWAKLSESSYAIYSNASPEQIYKALRPLLDSNDSLFVVTLDTPWFGQGNKEVINWLSSALQ